MSKRQLITESDVRNAASRGISLIRIAANAIITPLAFDISHSAGIMFEIMPEHTESSLEISVALAVTKAAFPLKRAVLDVLRGKGITAREVSDCTDDIKAATEIVRLVAGQGATYGVIMDETGIRSGMIANRFEGIRAVSASEVRHAQIARSRYDGNVVTLGAEFLTARRAADIVSTFLETKFAGKDS